MNPFAPFTGVLVLPDRTVFGRMSSVTLDTGDPPATIRWRNWTTRSRCDGLGQGDAAAGPS